MSVAARKLSTSTGRSAAGLTIDPRPEISKSKELRTVDVHDAVLKEVDGYLRQRAVRRSEPRSSSRTKASPLPVRDGRLDGCINHNPR